MKHLVINNPDHSAATNPSNESDLRRESAIRQQMFSSRQDGFQTPTISKYQLADEQTSEKRQERLSNDSPRISLRSGLNGDFRHHSVSGSEVSLGERVLEKLQWKERVRHYTWTFFTMTMATGGIANVLYSGTMKSEVKSLVQRLIFVQFLSIFQVYTLLELFFSF